MNTLSRVILSLTAIFSVGLMSFAPPVDELKVDLSSSEIKWTGYHLAKSYEHWGYINLKTGNVKTDGKSIVGGEFVIDMNSISDSDIESEENNAKLVGHLKSDDFFGVSKYPEAKLVIKKSELKSGHGFSISV